MHNFQMIKRSLLIINLIAVFFLNGCNVLSSLNPMNSIDFDSNFGTHTEPIIALPGKNIEEPSPPTKDHYTFSGWYTDRDFTEAFIFDKMPNDDVMLYAKWEGTIHETPEGLRLLLKDDDYYGVESYVGTNPDLIIPASYDGIDITSIEILAFKNNDIVETISLPNTITRLRYGAFYGADSITYFLIPNSVTELEGFLFTKCESLGGIEFEAGSQITKISDYAFYETSALNWINIPASVQEIGEAAFADCSLLSYITFESDEVLTTIGDGAFSTTGLLYVLIPASVINIGRHAFTGHHYHENMSIYVRPETRPSGWDEDWCYENIEVEWGSTRTLIIITFAEPNGTIIMEMEAISGTPWIDLTPHSISDRFQGWFMDEELTQRVTITENPETSITVYAKLNPS